MPRNAVILLAIAIGAGSWFAGRASVKQSTRSSTPRAEVKTEDPEYVATIEQLSRERDEMRVQWTEAQDRIAELSAAAEAKPEPESAAAADHGPRFQFADEENKLKVLDEIDWNSVGTSVTHLQPILKALEEAIREGKNPREIPNIGDIQRWNGPLITEALKAQNAGISGYQTNGAFTHPAIIVNAVYVTLREAGQPLTGEQETTLGALGDRFVEAEARRVAGYGDATLEAQKVLDEAKLKEELYTEIDRMLTATQRNSLHPEESRGITSADLFSSGLIWAQVAKPIGFTNREAFKAQITKILLTREKIPAAHVEAVKAVVDVWVTGLDDAFLAVPQSQQADARFMKVTHVIASAERLVKLREALIAAIADDDVRTRLRASPFVIVPYRTTGQ